MLRFKANVRMEKEVTLMCQTSTEEGYSVQEFDDQEILELQQSQKKGARGTVRREETKAEKKLKREEAVQRKYCFKKLPELHYLKLQDHSDDGCHCWMFRCVLVSLLHHVHTVPNLRNCIRFF